MSSQMDKRGKNIKDQFKIPMKGLILSGRNKMFVRKKSVKISLIAVIAVFLNCKDVYKIIVQCPREILYYLKGQVTNFEVDVRWPSIPKKLPVTPFESLYLSKKGEKRKKVPQELCFKSTKLSIIKRKT